MSRRSVIHPAQFHIQEEFAMFAPAADVTTGAAGARTGESRLRSLFAWGARCTLESASFYCYCGFRRRRRKSPARLLAPLPTIPAKRFPMLTLLQETRTPGRRAATTDSTGHYEFSSLPLGAYELSASKQGFATKCAPASGWWWVKRAR